MVTRASDVKPQVTVCTYTCEVCGSEMFQEVRGGAHLSCRGGGDFRRMTN